MTHCPTLLAAPLALVAACAPVEDPFAVAVDDAPPELPEGRFRVPASTHAYGTVEAGPARLARDLDLFGRIELDPEGVRHVVARFDGVVGAATPALGDAVEPGDVLSVLESSALSAARTDLVRRRHDLEYASLRLGMEEDLFERQLTSTEAVVERRHDVHEAEQALGAARKVLLAMGLDAAELEELTAEGLLEAAPWTRYEVTAPAAGRVLTKGARTGEAVAAGDLLFELADLDGLWVRLQVPLVDLELLPPGTELRLGLPGQEHSAACTVRLRLPEVDADTQLATLVAELRDPAGLWLPGTFVTATASLDEVAVPVAVPETALSWSQGPAGPEARVFVDLGGGLWEARAIEPGRSTGGRTQVLAGLESGERVATREMVALKSTWLGGGGLEE
mgnify:CR=1 FL=1